ncbi:11S globulin seed storage protein Ana o 2.0101-like [Solanum dulcamara]|uniref:11S globulin seed storage protein Ana o 2.0101-like n=1 Tax=Solanum dulcamara TaxID=45834 RepID=UPI0024857DD8|nr:11S globulin seed storage protein Ana o 2.0101-like [Solanum dulcamara]
MEIIKLSLCLFLLFNCCFSQIEQQQSFLWQKLQQQQQHRRGRAKTDCRISSINAREPTLKYNSEAGTIKFWDQNSEEFECAGVAAVRNDIQPKGLLLPHYNNAPQLLYIVQGSGILGTVIPGCAETYESPQREKSMREEQSRSEGESQFRTGGDRHQKIRQFRQGDVLALPAGITLWFYNNGQERLVTVALLDISNPINQLDLQFRHFLLAGSLNPKGLSGSGYEEEIRSRKEHEQGEQQHQSVNLFDGFDQDLLADVFNVDRDLVKNLKGREDQRGQIIRAENFDVLSPKFEEEEQPHRPGRGSQPNGLEETFCTMRFRENLGRPSRADVYNPRGGRISTLNSHKLPILNWLQLSAEKGVLYQNAVMAPYWNMNAHSIIYILRGTGRIQVVGDTGNSVFDDEVREGQMIVVPQNFAIVKKAGNEGLEYIAFKTNDQAMTSSLAGRLSAIRAMPEEVLMNSYQISRQEARSLKYNREEASVFAGRKSTGRKSMEYALTAVEAFLKA